jgi:hypothetical protein
MEVRSSRISRVFINMYIQTLMISSSFYSEDLSRSLHAPSLRTELKVSFCIKRM